VAVKAMSLGIGLYIIPLVMIAMSYGLINRSPQ
jgi:hypothetical protein